MEIDFARVCPVLPPGRQWENRGALTEFMRSVRSMLLRVEESRGRPYLLAARVPENLVGCHMDGLDVETWAREELVDIFAVGCRSYDVDIAAFRQATAGTHVKLYPVLDDHHSTDGYQWPPIEVFRGVMSNWLHQGADGLQTFNFAHARSETLARYGMKDLWPVWPTHLQFYRELADTGSMMDRSRALRGPEARRRPRRLSSCPTRRTGARRDGCTSTPTCSHPLPAVLDPDGRADTPSERLRGRRCAGRRGGHGAPAALGRISSPSTRRRPSGTGRGGNHRPHGGPIGERPAGHRHREPGRVEAEQRAPRARGSAGRLAGIQRRPGAACRRRRTSWACGWQTARQTRAGRSRWRSWRYTSQEA